MPPTIIRVQDRDREAEDLTYNPRYSTKEYVSNGNQSAAGQLVAALPEYIDDISRDFGIGIYEKMTYDSQVDSCLEILRLAILSKGVKLVNPIPAQDEDDSRQGQEILDFCKRCLYDHLEQNFESDFLYDMTLAMAYGNRVAEKVYEVAEYGQDEGKLVLRRLKVKPPRSYAFVVDPFNNILGLVGVGKESGYTSQAVRRSHARTLQDFKAGMSASQGQVFLPRNKFAIFTFRAKAGDPRGTSVLRPAYNAWWIKTQIWPEYVKFLTQFAGPSIIAKLPPNAPRRRVVDDAGNPVLDVDGNPTYKEPQTILLEAITGFKNGTGLVVPAGTEIDTLLSEMPAFSPFNEAIGLLDRQIAKAILCQTLATEEGRFQARAAAQTHQDVLELVIYHCRIAVKEMLRKEILRPLVEINFGREATRFTPDVSLSETERHDFAAIATAIARLVQVNYLHPNQYAGIDASLGIPPRNITAEQNEQWIMSRLTAARPMNLTGNDDGSDEAIPEDDGSQRDD